MRRFSVLAMLGVVFVLSGCEVSHSLDSVFEGENGLKRCIGACLELPDGTQAECEAQNGEWSDGRCVVFNAEACEALGGVWENYYYSILDLGGGTYIRKIEEFSNIRYICGSYANVYLDSGDLYDCGEKEIEIFEQALKYKLCTQNTTCQPAYHLQTADENVGTGGNGQLAICNSCPLNNIMCRDKEHGHVCTKIDSDPNHCGGCNIKCKEGLKCVDGVCDTNFSYVCKDEGMIACGMGAEGVPNCYDPKSMKTCGVVCENNTAQFTSCVQNEVCIKNDSVYSCQCLLMKDKSELGLVCGMGEDRRCIQPDAEATCGATCDSEGKKCPNHTQCKLVEGSYQCVCTDESLSIETHDGHITCINPQKDMTYCGLTKEDILAGKTHQCILGEECKEGECVCKEGYIKCGDACIDPSKDALHCGASGDCSQTASGENYRGEACGDAGVCENGVCHCNTENGYVLCDGECIDPTRNADYCGASGNCENGNRGTKCENVTPVCIDSVCKSNCPQGQDLCGSTCVDLKKDLKNCGVCGQSCQFENANAACWNSVCGIEVCKSGYGNCDNKDENGCEIDLMNDVRHCGVCGNACELPVGANGVSCEEGKCKMEWCEGSTLKCGDTCIDVSADINNCGACGNACSFKCYKDEKCEAKCENSGCCATGKLGPNPVVECCEGYELYRYITSGTGVGCKETYHYACLKPDEKENEQDSKCYIKI